MPLLEFTTEQIATIEAALNGAKMQTIAHNPHTFVAEWRREEIARYDSALSALRTPVPQPAMPEPSWADAPEWAMWWCVNANGSEFWFSDEPEVCGYFWDTFMKYERNATIEIPIGVDWRTLKRRRPTP